MNAFRGETIRIGVQAFAHELAGRNLLACRARAAVQHANGRPFQTQPVVRRREIELLQDWKKPSINGQQDLGARRGLPGNRVPVQLQCAIVHVVRAKARNQRQQADQNLHAEIGMNHLLRQSPQLKQFGRVADPTAFPQPAPHTAQNLLLPPASFQVRCAASRTRVPKGLQPIEFVHARVQQPVLALDLARLIRDAGVVVLLVLDGAFHDDVNPVHKVDNLLQATVIHQHVIMRVDAKVVENRLPQEIKAAELPAPQFAMTIDPVNPAHSPGRHPDQQVPRQAQHGRRTGIAIDGKDDNGIRALIGLTQFRVAAQQQNVHQVLALTIDCLDARRNGRDVNMVWRRVSEVT